MCGAAELVGITSTECEEEATKWRAARAHEAKLRAIRDLTQLVSTEILPFGLGSLSRKLGQEVVVGARVAVALSERKSTLGQIGTLPLC